MSVKFRVKEDGDLIGDYTKENLWEILNDMVKDLATQEDEYAYEISITKVKEEQCGK